jgi:hypothetical protein
MLLEVGVSVSIFGETVEAYVAKYATTPGAVGLALQIGFAAIPWVQQRLRG